MISCNFQLAKAGDLTYPCTCINKNIQIYAKGSNARNSFAWWRAVRQLIDSSLAIHNPLQIKTCYKHFWVNPFCSNPSFMLGVPNKKQPRNLLKLQMYGHWHGQSLMTSWYHGRCCRSLEELHQVTAKGFLERNRTWLDDVGRLRQD